jgi:hypothetical protein
MSFAQLAASIAAASSNLIVSADAEDQAVAITIDNINRVGINRVGVMASSHMESAPAVKLSRKESPSRLREPTASGEGGSL